jgi:hypothetical protein
VHPSVTKCPNCGAPMNATAAIANYWQITPRGVVKRDPAAKPKPEKPFPWHKVAWLFSVPAAAICVLVSVTCIAVALQPAQKANTGAMLAYGLIWGLIGGVLLTPAIFLTRRHRREFAAYLKQVAKDRDAESEEGPDQNAARILKKIPPPPPSPKIAWMICGPLAGIVLVWAAITLGPEQPAAMVVSCVIAAVMLVPAIRATGTSKRRWNERQRQMAALLKDKGSSEK